MGRPLPFLMAPLALLALASTSRAEPMIVVQSVEASSTVDPIGAPPDNLINGSGLNVLTNLHDTLPGHMWLANKTPSPIVTFHFGGLYWVSRLDIWNYNASASRRTKNFTVLAALDGSFTRVADDVFPPNEPVNVDLAPQVFAPLPFQASSVRLELTSSQDPFSQLIGLSEVQFLGSPVPEPSTLVGLLGMGLVGAGLAWRRMRRPGMKSPEA